MITYDRETEISIADGEAEARFRDMTEAEAAYEHTQTHPWAYAPDGDDAFQRFCTAEQARLDYTRACETLDSLTA